MTGQTPTAYLTEIKLQQAKPLLRQVSVTEAALELGYENISYFIRLFKNKFGLTPKQYQVQYQAGIPVG
ncbi:helix-turn-helix domain-containing protein [Vibrio cincinnatiensis]